MITCSTVWNDGGQISVPAPSKRNVSSAPHIARPIIGGDQIPSAAVESAPIASLANGPSRLSMHTKANPGSVVGDPDPSSARYETQVAPSAKVRSPKSRPSRSGGPASLIVAPTVIASVQLIPSAPIANSTSASLPPSASQAGARAEKGVSSAKVIQPSPSGCTSG